MPWEMAEKMPPQQALEWIEAYKELSDPQRAKKSKTYKVKRPGK